MCSQAPQSQQTGVYFQSPKKAWISSYVDPETGLTTQKYFYVYKFGGGKVGYDLAKQAAEQHRMECFLQAVHNRKVQPTDQRRALLANVRAKPGRERSSSVVSDGRSDLPGVPGQQMISVNDAENQSANASVLAHIRQNARKMILAPTEIVPMQDSSALPNSPSRSSSKGASGARTGVIPSSSSGAVDVAQRSVQKMLLQAGCPAPANRDRSRSGTSAEFVQARAAAVQLPSVVRHEETSPRTKALDKAVVSSGTETWFSSSRGFVTMISPRAPDLVPLRWCSPRGSPRRRVPTDPVQ